ncbi:MAG: trypsin-like peptidase domain-containing protein [Phycisphaerae bacterium]|nr:trypsin-like peptidase domain-containing protein [Phycisphaerae bacterium]
MKQGTASPLTRTLLITLIGCAATAILSGSVWADSEDAVGSVDLGTVGRTAADPAALARVRAYEHARIEVIHRLEPTVACLFNRGNRAGGGSGVIIDAEGYGLTNFHVIASMLEDRVGDAGLSDGRIYPIEVLGVDVTGDVAMFKVVRDEPFAVAELGDSDQLQVGDYTLAMGNPFLLAEDYAPTVTLGIVAGLHRYQSGAGEQGRALRYTDCIQVDTSINPGNSGGPLFDLGGRLVGINGRVSIEERSRVNVGVGYAISINQIKRFIPMLRAGITAKHATAGFTVFDRGRKVVVNQILEDSPPYKLGLRLGDEIVSFVSRPVTSTNQFISHLGIFPANWPVDVAYCREGVIQTIRFRLEDLPLPKQPQGEAGLFGGSNPFEKHRLMDSANRRAVRRARSRFHTALGGLASINRVTAIEMSGRRAVVDGGMPTVKTFENTEIRASVSAPSATMTPAEIERAIRWRWMAEEDPSADGACRVIAADEIDGRIAVVIEESIESGISYQAAFDDDTGELLRLEFKDSLTGMRAQYRYDDWRRVGRIRWPYRRMTYQDERLYSIDEFDLVVPKG